jgi:hypothetical protein
MAVQLKQHAIFGVSLYAEKNFLPGEVVLKEEPLLTTLSKSARLYQTAVAFLEELVKDPVNALWDTCLENFLAWCTASAPVQREVVESMHSSIPAQNWATTADVVTCKQAADLFVKELLPKLGGQLARRAPIEVETVERVLLAWHMNAHSLGDR